MVLQKNKSLRQRIAALHRPIIRDRRKLPTRQAAQASRRARRKASNPATMMMAAPATVVARGTSEKNKNPQRGAHKMPVYSKAVTVLARATR